MPVQSPEPSMLSFVVPCYNEAENILDTLASITKAMEQVPFSYEIIIVDDKSRDNTLEVARAAAQTNPRIRVIANVVNLGLGGTYKAGAAQAAGDYVMLVPGDNGFPAECITRTVMKIGSADIIIPYVTNTSSRGVPRTVLHYSFTALLNFLFWIDVKYYNGPVVHKAALLKTITIGTNGFAYQAEALVKLISGGASYAHIDVRVQDRAAGVSTALSKTNRIRVYKTIYRLLSEIGFLRRFRFPPLAWAQEPNAAPAASA